MQFLANINLNGLRTCLLVLLTLRGSVVTSQRNQMLMNAVQNKRFNVAPRDVMTHSCGTRCTLACLVTSWCVSANLQTGDGTCQLLSEEVSDDDESLQSAGDTYVREF